MLRTDKANENLINAEVTELLPTNEEKITHPNIKRNIWLSVSTISAHEF